MIRPWPETVPQPSFRGASPASPSRFGEAWRFTKRCACHELCTWRFTKYCTCHAICTWRFTKCCACHEICTWRFTKCCACHEICTWRFTKCCACHEICAWRFTQRCACHEICTWRFTKRGVPATKSAHGVHFKALCLPRNLHFKKQVKTLTTMEGRFRP